MPSGDVATVAPGSRRPAFVSVGIMALLTVTGLLIKFIHVDTAGGATPQVLRFAVPGSLLAVALALTHVAGSLDLSLGAISAALTTALASSTRPNDAVVIAMVAAVMVAAVVSGQIVSRFQNPTVAGLVVYFVVVQITSALTSGSNRTTSIDSSVILTVVGGSSFGFPNDVLLLCIVLAATTFLLFRTGLGLRIRARGLDSSATELLSGPTGSAQMMAQAIAGFCVAAGALIIFSRGGTNVGGSGVDDLLSPIAATVIGLGGLSRTAPSLVRVATATFLLRYLTLQMDSLQKVWVNPDVLTGLLVLVAMALTAPKVARHDS